MHPLLLAPLPVPDVALEAHVFVLTLLASFTEVSRKLFHGDSGILRWRARGPHGHRDRGIKSLAQRYHEKPAFTQAAGFICERGAMQPGEMIANTFAAILAVCGLALVFLVAGRPLFPKRQARMVVILPADQNTTASIINKHPHLPMTFNLALAPSRPPPRI
ncbi:hypothetical protein [Mesorhizobium montanum]|uniref:hypothetical protein n=1 Tax=Mesorhizobium montanum TaxID=3072323 RepID=UPI002A24904C|nr:hypothetical protein [Mesorhizobium sp. MSK_1335]